MPQIHPDSASLALRVSMEVHAAGLSDVIIGVDPSAKADGVYICFINRSGALRRQGANGANMISWLQAKPRLPLSAQVDLERYYHIYLRRQREQQSPSHLS